MPGEPLRFSTIGRHNIHVDVAGILRTEGNQLSVGRELGILGRALEAGDPTCQPAALVDRPDVVRVGERDLRLTDGWGAKHARLRCRNDGGREHRGEGDEHALCRHGREWAGVRRTVSAICGADVAIEHYARNVIRLECFPTKQMRLTGTPYRPN